MKSTLSTCAECGMAVSPGEYHPFAACLMFKACHDGDKVRVSLDAVRSHSAQQDAEKVDAKPDPTLQYEQALSELVGKIVPGLDSGDILADAQAASAALLAQPASGDDAQRYRDIRAAVLTLGENAIWTAMCDITSAMTGTPSDEFDRRIDAARAQQGDRS